jgi:hypothetical protein
MTVTPPRFSVVLATRDRPALFTEVLARSHDHREIIVVDEHSRPAWARWASGTAFR